MESNLATELDLAFIDSTAAVAVVGHPERRRILQALASAPDSASGLADRLDDSRQRINYHVRALEDAGLIELAEERPRRGFTEKIYRASGRRFAIDPSVLGPLDAGEQLPAEGDRRAAVYAVALAARTTRELASLGRRARSEAKRLAVASLDTSVSLASPQAMEAFVDDLARAVADVVARHDEPGAGSRPFRVICCAHPAPDDTGDLDPRNLETE